MKSGSSVRPILVASFIVVFALCNVVFSGQISTNINFSQPHIETIDGKHRVSLQNALNIGEPGKPSMPSMGIWMALPPGNRAESANLVNVVWEELPGEYVIEPAAYPQRLSDPVIPEVVPDPSIYKGTQLFPFEQITSLKTHLKRGVSVASCLIWPVRWNPVDGKIEYMTSAQLLIDAAPGQLEMTGYNRFYRGDSKTKNWAENLVENPNLLGAYPRRDDPELQSMLIITDEEFLEQANEFANWKNRRGFITYVRTFEQVIEGEEGIDDQDRMRNGIITAYEELEIEYLLLLGDDELLPHRGFFGAVNNSPDYDVPADLYYGALDGNWNEDDDAEWGEFNEADFTAEIFVGRIPADNVEEATRSFTKIMRYSDEPTLGNELMVLMVGEELGWECMGGDYMDEVYSECNRYNYSTSGYPERFVRRNLYDRDRVWGAANNLAPLISEGYHFINHLGHSNTRYTMKIDWNNFNQDLIENDGQGAGYNILWTQGCYGGSFDNRVPNGNYVQDCISEGMFNEIDNGFVAIISNSRYGWGDGASTNGASQHFHREFVDAIFDENMTVIGEANQDSKEDSAPWAEWGVYRWCYYEINLFGDPSMDMWTDIPIPIQPEYERMIVIGDETYTIELTDIQDAVACLSRDNQIIAFGHPDENGIIEIEIPDPIVPPGPVSLSIVAHDFIPELINIQSIAPDDGYPWVDEILIEDIDGNGDTNADAGETIELLPSIRNLGRDPLDELIISFIADDPAIKIITGQVTIDGLDGQHESFCREPIIIEVNPDCGDLHEVNFALTLDNGEEVWTQEASFTTHAPILGQQFLTILDEDGNDNGRLDPGEETDVVMSINNVGSGCAYNVEAEVFSGSPFIEVLQSESSTDIIESNDIGVFDPAFRILVSEDCPNPERAVLYVRYTGNLQQSHSAIINLNIGGAIYAFDRNEELWDHEVLNDEHEDQWHDCNNDNHTFGGSNCIKVGDRAPNGEYLPMLNCAIYMPPFFVEDDLSLSFWHKIDAEESGNHPGEAYDGGVVEVSIDNGDWEIIEPITPDNSGYPYITRRGNAPSPFINGQPIFSGTFDWAPVSFDLSDFAGTEVQVRFRFGSDGGVNGGGWWIDDIELYMPMDAVAPDNLDGEMVEGRAHMTWDTPIPERDEGMVNDLIGYRIYRGSDDWLGLDTLIIFNEYVDDLREMPRGEYMYMVTAQYADIESQPSNFLFLTHRWRNSVETDESDLPKDWAIDSVWPNPFNSTTQINYSVPIQGKIELIIFDQNGRFVQNLVNENMQPGRYNATFSADNLSTGIYFVLMNTPTGIRTAKLILIK